MAQSSEFNGDGVQRINADAASPVVLVCEHATSFIPAMFDDLGLAPHLRESHAVWDPGAMAVARRMAQGLGAALVASGVSRLVYDCNRPPHDPSAMPARSEVVEVPGNRDLTARDRADRATAYYEPFRQALADQIAQTDSAVIVTIHSFTPIYYGQRRDVEIGVLHDSDTRLADAMLDLAPIFTDANVQRNQPYGPADGVTHTLREHALPDEHLNVMLEIRNDLIVTDPDQIAMADLLVVWLSAALDHCRAKGASQCHA